MQDLVVMVTWTPPSPQDDREFRDKITPISVVMEYSLDYQLAADRTGLLPILDMTAPSDITKQVPPPSPPRFLSSPSLFPRALPVSPALPPPLRLTSSWTAATITSVSPT